MFVDDRQPLAAQLAGEGLVVSDRRSADAFAAIGKAESQARARESVCGKNNSGSGKNRDCGKSEYWYFVRALAGTRDFMIEVNCCGTEKLKTSESAVGKKIRCPSCGRVVQIVSGEALAQGAGAGDFDAALEVENGSKLSVSRYVLGGIADIEIGKLSSNQIVLPGERVSRRHCKLVRIDFGPPRWKIVDQNSTNGLFRQRRAHDPAGIGGRRLHPNWGFHFPLHGGGWHRRLRDLVSHHWVRSRPRERTFPPLIMPHPIPSHKHNGMAIAGFIMGIAMCIPLCGILAIVFSTIGLSPRQEDENWAGFAPAIVGLVLGVLGTVVITPILIAILLPSLDRAREIANRVQCMQNMK